ncbi:RING/U-box superfamily protein [Striga asiatica]|uniref:RING/U-box superfamily protein n=1 Tax=Striga asiatica TaxID=4170 RepID=A0A5A7Q8Z2_STRAF|nr:RING/U-box superfamily protein [Striga asiatica]
MVVSDQFVLCKVALIFALTRWLLSLALSLLTNSFTQTSSSSCRSSTSSSSSCNLRILSDSLSLTTLEKIEHRLRGSHDRNCAVCLYRLRKDSQIWELSNCCHVFHRHCLEKWLCYDDRLTCPLCRASLIADSRPPPVAAQPSWAVERMLYLFGDDLLP